MAGSTTENTGRFTGMRYMRNNIEPIFVVVLAGNPDAMASWINEWST